MVEDLIILGIYIGFFSIPALILAGVHFIYIYLGAVISSIVDMIKYSPSHRRRVRKLRRIWRMLRSKEVW